MKKVEFKYVFFNNKVVHGKWTSENNMDDRKIKLAAYLALVSGISYLKKLSAIDMCPGQYSPWNVLIVRIVNLR